MFSFPLGRTPERDGGDGHLETAGLIKKSNSFISPSTPNQRTKTQQSHPCVCVYVRCQRVEGVCEGVKASARVRCCFYSTPLCVEMAARTFTAMCVTGQMTDWYQLKCFASDNGRWMVALLNTHTNVCSLDILCVIQRIRPRIHMATHVHMFNAVIWRQHRTIRTFTSRTHYGTEFRSN